MLLSFDKPPEMCLGSVQHRKEGHGCAEAVEQEDVFFVTIVLSFVSMIVFLREQRGNLCGRKEAGIEEGTPAWKR